MCRCRSARKTKLKRPQEAAEKIGSKKHHTIDAKDEFAKDYAFRCIKTNALYEGYPLSTAFARPLIAKKIVEIAEKEGAATIAHGCTGKGNEISSDLEATIRSESDSLHSCTNKRLQPYKNRRTGICKGNMEFHYHQKNLQYR